MNQTRKNLVIGLGSLLAIGLATGAKGSTLQFTSTVPSADIATGFPQSFTLQKFDTSLGTLNSIDLFLTGKYAGTIKVFNSNTTDETLNNANASIQMTLTGPGPVSLSVSPAVSVTGPANLPHGQTLSFLGGTGTATGSLSVPGADFSLYTYSGGPAQFGNYSVDVQNANAGGSGSNAGLFFSAAGTASGSATVVYTYTQTVPPGTPEPGSVALLCGMGVTGMAFVYRRRRIKK